MLTRIAGSHSSTRNYFTVVLVSETKVPLRNASRIAAKGRFGFASCAKPAARNLLALAVAVGSELRPEVPLVAALAEVTLHTPENTANSVGNGPNDPR